MSLFCFVNKNSTSGMLFCLLKRALDSAAQLRQWKIQLPRCSRTRVIARSDYNDFTAKIALPKRKKNLPTYPIFFRHVIGNTGIFFCLRATRKTKIHPVKEICRKTHLFRWNTCNIINNILFGVYLSYVMCL